MVKMTLKYAMRHLWLSREEIMSNILAGFLSLLVIVIIVSGIVCVVGTPIAIIMNQ